MGRIRNAIVKRAARKIVECYFQKLEHDFHMNKLVVSDVADIQSKRIRNKVAGYVTILMKRISTGTVKGIHIKEHEEERERRQSVVPKTTVVDDKCCVVDEVTMGMVQSYNIKGNYMLENVGGKKVISGMQGQ